MKDITPEFYKKFKCIAGSCRHNCCIGWEIDVDGYTMERYSRMETPFGEKIRSKIEGDPSHFILEKNDRCPFLNEENLCDIICNIGEEGLCEICRLHPRFKNFYDGFTETGLGLCCEEAARLILCETEPFLLKVPKECVISEEERIFFAERQKIFDALQDREKTILKRFQNLAHEYCLEFDFDLNEVADFLISLERLDDDWTRELDGVCGYSFDGSIFENQSFGASFEQLSTYFVFRHAADYGCRDAVKFSLLSCFVIGVLWAQHNCFIGDEKMIDIVRMFSSEIEYSDENTQYLMNF